MSMLRRAAPVFPALLAGVATAQIPQYLVAPAAYADADAIAYEWLAGASRELRQQTLVGASHLAVLVGHPLTAIELRRSAANEVYQGGTMHWTVTLSIAPHVPLEASDVYAANVGSNAVQVFAGMVTLPTSPAATGPTVAWTPDNVLRIPFTTPFVYTGGTLCIDVVGVPQAGQNAEWWMADAMFEDVGGTVVELGGGCGSYGGPEKDWSAVAPRSLVPGAYARMFAYGPAWSIGLVMVGTKSPVPIPLTWLGFNSPPECNLLLATLDLWQFEWFVPSANPLLVARGGEAAFRAKIPNLPPFLGMTLTTQWIEATQLVSSNAVEWTIANAAPALDMALVEGSSLEAIGEVSVHLAPVVRFEFQ